MANKAPPRGPAAAADSTEDEALPPKKYTLGFIDASNIGKKLRVRKSMKLSDPVTATVGLNYDIITKDMVPVGEVSVNVKDYCRLSFNDKRMSVSRSFRWDYLGGAAITLGVGCKYTGGAPNLKFNYVPRPHYLKAIAGGFALRSGQRIHAVPNIDIHKGKSDIYAEMDMAIMRKGVNEGQGAKGGLCVDLCSLAGIIAV